MRLLVALAVTLMSGAMLTGCDRPPTLQACTDAGVAYYKERGAYPRLTTGENAEGRAKKLCENNLCTFNFGVWGVKDTSCAPREAPNFYLGA